MYSFLPEEFLGDAAVECLLGGEEREGAVAQIEAHLRAEQRAHAGPRAVALDGARVDDLADEGQVLLLVVLHGGLVGHVAVGSVDAVGGGHSY